MADANATLIIRKKRGKPASEAHHGGAWKVAYADFVTAMMAFFLLMWLLNATTEQQRKGLADYFDPSVPISQSSSGGTSVLKGDDVKARQDLAGSVSDGTRMHEPDSRQTPGATDEHLAALTREIEASLSAVGEDVGRHFILHLEPDGLVIEIADARDAALFASGSATPGPLLERLLDVLAPVIARAENPIKVAGHTDTTGGSDFDNWALSGARANAARTLLEDRGLPEEQFAEVAGLAATRPLVPDASAPQNRRISVTLLRQPPR